MKNDEVLCASISAYGFDLVFFIYLIFLHQELQHVKKIKFRVIFFFKQYSHRVAFSGSKQHFVLQ